MKEMHESPTDLEGIKKATGKGYRKHLSEYEHDLMAIPIAYPEERRLAVYTTNELTSVCPMTGLPDFYDLLIEYIPTKTVVELKTMKFYLGAYRDVGVLHEDLAVKIKNDIWECINPWWVRVTLKAQVRGGIETTVIAEEGERHAQPSG